MKAEGCLTSLLECPICCLGYDKVDPTTFPCGHTCCLNDALELKNCPFCRMKLGSKTKMVVNIVLRDCALHASPSNESPKHNPIHRQKLNSNQKTKLNSSQTNRKQHFSSFISFIQFVCVVCTVAWFAGRNLSLNQKQAMERFISTIPSFFSTITSLPNNAKQATVKFTTQITPVNPLNVNNAHNMVVMPSENLYTGPYLKGVPHGHGEFSSKLGTLSAYFERGEALGDVQFKYFNGDVYEGPVDTDYNPSGVGKLTFSDQKTFIGHFLNGHINGLGQLSLPPPVNQVTYGYWRGGKGYGEFVLIDLVAHTHTYGVLGTDGEVSESHVVVFEPLRKLQPQGPQYAVKLRALVDKWVALVGTTKYHANQDNKEG